MADRYAPFDDDIYFLDLFLNTDVVPVRLEDKKFRENGTGSRSQ